MRQKLTSNDSLTRMNNEDADMQNMYGNMQNYDVPQIEKGSSSKKNDSVYQQQEISNSFVQEQLYNNPANFSSMQTY